MHIDYGTWTCSDSLEFQRCERALYDVEIGEPARKQEFYGFIGVRWEKDSYGTRFVGTRDTDGYSMISCSGYAAHIEAERLRFLSCWRPSRIDIAVDIERHFDVPGAYTAWQGKSRTKITAIENQTLYIGSRKSEIFWRVYDKAEELGRPELAPLWRIELELKGERARQFWGFWQQHSAHLPGILRGYLWQADGSPREPANSLLGSLLEAEEAWHIGSLPRRRRAGEEYLWGNVLPFLRANWEWVGPIIQEQLMKGDRDCT
jgi:hypothetical protein